MIDTADMYGSGENEKLLGPFVQKHRQVFPSSLFLSFFHQSILSLSATFSALTSHFPSDLEFSLRPSSRSSVVLEDRSTEFVETERT